MVPSECEKKCFIMLCSNQTEGVCIEKKIMGAAAHREIEGIEEGTEGLLWNYKTKELIGIFRALEKPRDRSNKPDPWQGTGKGPYPLQFRVDIVGDSIMRLPRAREIFEKSGIKTIPAHLGSKDEFIPESSVYPMDALIAFKMGIGTGAFLRRAGMRAAVAAIMGRNMSHNIGSHVLARLTEADGILKDKEEAKCLFEYLQRRMDFIAQVSTSAPSWAVELRWCDVIDQFKGQKLLLDNILRFKEISFYDLDIIAGQENRDVSFPTRLVGCHALYTIFENVLRNAARYGHRNGSLVLKVRLEEYNSDFYKLSIADNCKNGSDSLIGKLNDMFGEDLVDQKGNLNGNYWGMKEIKIAAAYLRFIEQEDIDTEYKELAKTVTPLVKVLHEDGNLKYEFFLQKPKKILFLFKDKRLKNNAFTSYGFDCDELVGEVIDKARKYRFLVLPESERGREHKVEPPIRTIYRDISEEKNPSGLYRSIWQTWLSTWSPDSLHAPVVIRAGRVKDNTPLSALLEKAGFVIISEKEDPDLPGAVVFDHASNISAESELYRSARFHVPFSGGDALYNLWHGDEEELELVRYYLLEAAFTNVAVVDSRISEEAHRPAGASKIPDGISLGSVWSRMGVDLLDHQPIVESFGAFVQDLVHQKYKFLVFHQGELDNIIQKDKVFDEHWKMLKNKVGHIVIDTGRGRPDQAKKDGLRWLPYTDLQDIIIGQIRGNNASVAKYNLVKLLFSLVPETVTGVRHDK